MIASVSVKEHDGRIFLAWNCDDKPTWTSILKHFKATFSAPAADRRYHPQEKQWSLSV